MTRSQSLASALGTLTVAFTAAIAAPGGYDVSWYTIDNGGGASVAGVYSVGGTIAQPEAGAPMFGDDFAIQGGFWHGGPMIATLCNQWTHMDVGFDNGGVGDFEVYNGELVVAGGFTSIAGQTVNRIARWNGSYWTPLGTGMNNGVVALTMFNNQLVAGGAFTTAGGQPANRVAQWNGSLWQPIGAGLPDTVYDLIVYNNQLIACGPFYGGATENGVARWTGSTWEPMGSSHLYWNVWALAIFNGELIGGGVFQSGFGNPRFHVARWNGFDWAPLGTLTVDPFNASFINALTVHDDELIAGGSLYLPGGNFASIARWNGVTWQVDTGLIGQVDVLNIYNGDVIAGGAGFFSTGNYGIARWNGASWQSIGTGFDDFVTALGIYNGALIAGGTFTPPRDPFNRVARWRDCAAPQCPGDITGDQEVTIDDLLAVINSWGPCSGCPADVNGDGIVNIDDLLAVVSSWGTCP